MSNQGRPKVWSQSEIELFREMYDGDWTLLEIITEFNTTNHSVRLLRERLGIPERKRRHQNKDKNSYCENKFRDLARDMLRKWRKINCSGPGFRSLKMEFK